MALIIEQAFHMGRFHANRWNQNPFEDPYGEWPPSPWRLLRALAARWFQHARETADEDASVRDALLAALASELPEYVLPAATERGPAVKQYQPTEVTWTDASKKASAVKLPKTTLVEDHYRIVPEAEPVVWVWSGVDLSERELNLLGRLLERTLYFGRAESACRMRIVTDLGGAAVNCRLQRENDGASAPVLAPVPGQALRLEVLLAATGDDVLYGRPVPPGTAWFFAPLPPRPRHTLSSVARPALSSGQRLVQFAVGGRVLPVPGHWLRVTECFRGAVLKHAARILSGGAAKGYSDLHAAGRAQLTLLSGKDQSGRSLGGNHRHAFFSLWPACSDSSEQLVAERLLVWRDSPFEAAEIEAMLRASEDPIEWERGSGWLLRLVPLPFGTPPPLGFEGPARTWRSIVPFVPPAGRHRFRENGRLRPGESADASLRRLLAARGAPLVEHIDVADAGAWLPLHLTRDRRRLVQATGTPLVRPGFRATVQFAEPCPGPLFLGDSCHYGLGSFASVPD